MRVAFLGATRGMGRALARKIGARRCAGMLGRDEQELERSAADLETLNPGVQVGTFRCDLERFDKFAPALDYAEHELGALDAVVVTAGMFATQQALEEDPELTARLLDVDFRATVLFCEEARHRLLARGGGTLCVFGSVAGDRGRRPVGLYGAAKAGLACYLEALDHRYRREGLQVVCVKPGFVKTSMTDGLRVPPFAGEPDRVAVDVLRAINRGTPVIYTPAAWRWILGSIRLMPRAVMRRVDI